MKFLQLYANKTKTSIKFSVLPFYPLHMKFINFEESMQDMMCNHRNTMLAVLPVKFMNMMNGDYLERKV